MSEPFSFRAGQVVITQGDAKSIISLVIKWSTGSWWTHGFVVLSETEGIESIIPRVTKLNIKDKLQELRSGNRDFIVMEMDGLTDDERQSIANAALVFLGRMYDILGCVFFVIFKSWYEGTKRTICSRLMSSSYFDGIQHNIFADVGEKLPESLKYRTTNLKDGYCSPDEVLRYSDLKIVYREKN